MLNLAGFGPDEHQLFIQAGIEGLRDILDLDARRVPGARPPRPRSSWRWSRPATSRSTAGGSRRGRSRTSDAAAAPSLGRTGYDERGEPRSAAVPRPSLIGIATAVVIVAVAILPFLSPAWVAFEQGARRRRPGPASPSADLRDRDGRDPRRPRHRAAATSTSRSPARRSSTSASGATCATSGRCSRVLRVAAVVVGRRCSWSRAAGARTAARSGGRSGRGAIVARSRVVVARRRRARRLRRAVRGLPPSSSSRLARTPSTRRTDGWSSSSRSSSGRRPRSRSGS